MNILVLESSTTSAKVMLYDTADQAHTIETKAYPLYYDNATLHNAESALMETAALGKKLCSGKRIDAVALSGTWHGVMLCDAGYRPVTPVYLWANTEPAEMCRRLREDDGYTRDYYQRTGCMVNAIYPAFKLKLFRERGCRLEDYHVADQGTYNNFRLTGEKTATDCMVSGAGLLNIRERRLDRAALDELGVSESNFARLVTYKDSCPLSEEGARLLGIEPGIPVIPACPDGALNQIGAGALGRGIMTLSAGTSGAVRIATPKPVLPDIPSTWCYLAPETWLSGAAISGCCNCVDWYKNKMFGPDKTYDEIESAFESTFQGAAGTPVFLPFLFGERCPGWRDDRKAAFFDVTPLHTRHDLYHSVLEGVLFNLCQCYAVLTEINGVPKKVKLSGGIVNSLYWSQMCSDIFGLEMEVDSSQHGSLMGAAVLGMEKLGVIGGISAFSVEARKKFRPNLKKAAMYREKYERYLHCYEKTK